jgi:hypothetical protein
MEVDTSIPDAVQEDNQSGQIQNEIPAVVNATTSASAEPQPLEKWTKTIHPRGRPARDPLGQTVRYACTSAEEMEQSLREYLAAPTSPPEHTTVQFTFSTSSAFPVYTGDYLGGSQTKSNVYGTLNRSALSVEAALAPVDLKDSLKKQKSIAKTLVEHITKADGFHYSFHNNWLSKEDEAHRFSYFCNDSTLNKGRAANEASGMGHKRKMKPVYDCHGTVHVKFSVTKQHVELHYKHVPIHETYEARAPPPRKNSKRRKIMEIFEPEKLVPKRKRTKEEKLAIRRQKRRAAALEAEGGDADAGTDSLSPLIQFLGSADGEIDRDTESPVQNGGSSAPVVYSAERLEQLKQATKGVGKRGKDKQPRRKYTRRQGNVRPPNMNVPGMMSGYMSGDMISWGAKTKPQKPGTGNEPAPQAPQEPLAGIAQAAAAATDADNSSGLSELELLKAKLAAAEARINRLEGEKNTPTPTQGPPGWPPPPAPPSYAFPGPPQFGGTSPYPQVPQFQYPPPTPTSADSSAHRAPPPQPLRGVLVPQNPDTRLRFGRDPTQKSMTNQGGMGGAYLLGSQQSTMQATTFEVVEYDPATALQSAKKQKFVPPGRGRPAAEPPKGGDVVNL